MFSGYIFTSGGLGALLRCQVRLLLSAMMLRLLFRLHLLSLPFSLFSPHFSPHLRRQAALSHTGGVRARCGTLGSTSKAQAEHSARSEGL